jgi:hypothetical protein
MKKCVAATGLLALVAGLNAQTIPRMKLTDGELSCAQIHAEIGQMDDVLALNAASPMGQQARARKEFLTGFFVQRGCRTSDLGAAQAQAKPASPAPRPALAAAPVAPTAAPPSAPDWRALLQGPLPVIDGGAQVVKGSADLKGKRYYVSEYRVLFEVNGTVTASSRAAYFGGTNYGGTRVTVNYQVANMDIAALQALVDRSYADFLARLDAAGAKPEPAEPFIREFGTVYDASLEPTRPGAPVIEDQDLGFGNRRYMVFAPSGMKLNPRGMAGLGAGNLGNRMAFIKGNVEAISVSIAVNLAAQESSGSGSSLFRSGSSANASAAMEMVGTRANLFQSHAHTHGMRMDKPLPVPGQFATFRETGGYDSRQDAAVQGIQALGRLMGQAGNQNKRVEMAIDVDTAAMVRLAAQGIATVNQGIAANIR